MNVSFSSTHSHGLNWSPAEKATARRTFDQALQGELEAVIAETKSRAATIQHASDIWELEQFLTKRRSQIGRRFDYRYSVLTEVFGDLLHRGRLAEEDLKGLGEDKLAAIRRYGAFLGSPIGSDSAGGEEP